MKTTLNLDRELLERAKTALDADSFTEAIERALREAVTRHEARAAWDALTRAELSWHGVDDLLDYRRQHGGRAL